MHRFCLSFLRVTVPAIALASVLFLAARTGYALQAEAPVAPPTPRNPGHEIDASALEMKLAALETRTDLGPEVKAKLADAWSKAIENARQAAAWEAHRARLEQERLGAPQRLLAIKLQMEQLKGDPSVAIPPTETLAQAEQQLTAEQAALAASQQTLKAREEEIHVRGERRKELPQRIAEARSQMDEARTEMVAPASDDEPLEVAEARRTRWRASERMSEAAIRAYEEELTGLDVRDQVAVAEQDLELRRIAYLENHLALLQEYVDERRRAGARAAKESAESELRAQRDRHALLGNIAAENSRYAERHAELTALIREETKDSERTRKLLVSQTEGFIDLKRRVETLGLTETVGRHLHAERRRLLDTRGILVTIRQKAELQQTTQIELYDLEQKQRSLIDTKEHAAALLVDAEAKTKEPTWPEVRAWLLPAMERLIEAQHGYVQTLIDDCNRLSSLLVTSEANNQQLLRKSKEVQRYIEERVLWVQSAPPLWRVNPEDTIATALWLVSPANWRAAAGDAIAHVVDSPFPYVLAFLGLVLYYLAQRPLRRMLVADGEAAERSTNLSLRPTLRAIVVTLVLSVSWAVVFSFAAWLLKGSGDASGFSLAVATGLREAAMAALTFEALRQLCQHHGLAEAHFHWRPAALQLVRRQVFWLRWIVLPAIFIEGTTGRGRIDPTTDFSLATIAFAISIGSVTVFLWRVLHPSHGILSDADPIDKKHRRQWLRYLGFSAAIASALALVGLAVGGYYFTADRLTMEIIKTSWLVLGLMGVQHFVLLWLRLARRKLMMRKLEAQRRAAEAMADPHAPAPGAAGPPPVPEHMDVQTIDTGVRKLLHGGIAVIAIVALAAIWADVLPALNILRRVEMGWGHTVNVSKQVPATDGKFRTEIEEIYRPATLADLLLAIAVLGIAFFAAKNVPALLEIALLSQFHLHQGERFAISTTVRYAITAGGIIFACGAVGISWSHVQWLAAALSVGLGFGLQEIFANFISGLILLFERPIRVGDIVTVGNVEGRVSRIRIRATTIVDADRRELLVPNKDFITGQVINWTLTDTITRVVIPVGVAYGTDTNLVRSLLLRIARESRHVLSDPPPEALFLRFGASTLDFELRVFLTDRTNWADMVHDLHTRIHDELGKAGIEISFPQQDLHIRSAKPFTEFFARWNAETQRAERTSADSQ